MKLFKKISSILFVTAVSAALVVAGCGKQVNTAAQDTTKEDTTPITLTIGLHDTPDKFDSMVGNLIKKRFPYITFQYIQYQTGTQLPDLINQNKVPDLMEGNGEVKTWSDLGLAYDLAPLVAKYKMDLSRFNQSFLANIRRSDPAQKDTLYAIPYYDFRLVLFYNKDIFDKFGVKYPTDGMTWDQVYSLAKQVTKSDNGVQYRGLQPDDYSRLAREYPLMTLDPKTDQPIVQNDQWTKFFNFFRSIYQIPGNLDPKHLTSDYAGFLTDKNVAMWTFGTNIWDQFEAAGQNGLHWDMVSYPIFSDIPDQGPAAAGLYWGISSSSNYKDQAFRVISFIESDEVQTFLAKNGYSPSVTTPADSKDYGTSMPTLQGKNIQATFFIKRPFIPKKSATMKVLQLKRSARTSKICSRREKTSTRCSVKQQMTLTKQF